MDQDKKIKANQENFAHFVLNHIDKDPNHGPEDDDTSHALSEESAEKEDLI